MSQYLKSHVHERILLGAAETFAERGYSQATMRQIADAAGVSLGNLYRYFEGKDSLFTELLPECFVHTFEQLIRRRVLALRGVADIATLPPDTDYRIISDELLHFCFEHRFQVVVLLSRSEGTVYETFGAGLVQQLVSLALDHAQSVGRRGGSSEPERFALELIYRNFVEVMVQSLIRYDDESELGAFIQGYERYHLAGLKSFFEGEQG